MAQATVYIISTQMSLTNCGIKRIVKGVHQFFVIVMTWGCCYHSFGKIITVMLLWIGVSDKNTERLGMCM